MIGDPGCNFVTRSPETCGEPTGKGMRVRHHLAGEPSAEDWATWPVCERHEWALACDLESMGFVVGQLVALVEHVERGAA